MSKVKMTITLSRDLAQYLRSKPNTSSVIAEAVTEYRANELEHRLDEAYREDAEEAQELNEVWARVDAPIDTKVSATKVEAPIEKRVDE